MITPSCTHSPLRCRLVGPAHHRGGRPGGQHALWVNQQVTRHAAQFPQVLSEAPQLSRCDLYVTELHGLCLEHLPCGGHDASCMWGGLLGRTAPC